MTRTTLGRHGPTINRIGYGAMVLEGYYGGSEDEAAINTLVHAIESDIMLDSADAYGEGHNENLIAKAIQQADKPAYIATKFGIVFDGETQGSKVPTGWGFDLTINGTPEYAARCLDDSLQRLGVDYIDLWYAHYPDPAVPIEDTVGAMGEAVKSGKVKSIGLSNVTPNQVRQAHAEFPISAVQYEYSLWRREAEDELLPLLRELGIALVAWSPLGSGFLTGTVDKLDENDFRNFNPRYSQDNIGHNRDRFAPLMDIADELSITPAQLALAWLLHQGDDIIPIPGTRKAERIDENLAAAEVKLHEATLSKIDDIASPGAAQGATLLTE